jgi:hypothetical protein
MKLKMVEIKCLKSSKKCRGPATIDPINSLSARPQPFIALRKQDNKDMAENIITKPVFHIPSVLSSSDHEVSVQKL